MRVVGLLQKSLVVQIDGRRINCFQSLEETEHHKHRQETIEVKVQRNMSRQIWLMPQQGPRGSLGLGWNLSWGLAL